MSASAETITIATGEYAPWTGKSLKHHGFVNHVISEAFKKEGYTVEYKYYPWKRNYQQAKKNKVQATSYWYQSADRKKEFFYSDPVSTEKLVFFHLKSKTMKEDWKSLKDLNEYQIGATRGYTYTEDFWKAAKSKQLKVQVANSDKKNFGKLLKGRIDLFPATVLTGLTLLRKDFANKSSTVIFHPKALTETTGHLLFSKTGKDSKKLLKIFNRGLAQLKKEGIYDQLLKELLAGKYSQ